MAGDSQITIAVFGVSGVGKTTTIRRVMQQRKTIICHLQASQLIKEGLDRVVNYDELRKADQNRILANQEVLISEYQRQTSMSSASVVVFDGHSVIDGADGYVPIPADVIRQLSPTRLVFLSELPDVIAVRRQADSGRDRPERTQEQLAAMQSTALEICKEYSESLGIPLDILNSGDAQGLESLLVIDW